MKDKLKPCPFCGSADIYLRRRSVDNSTGEDWQVTCRNCESSADVYTRKQSAMAAWNTRSEPQWQPFDTAPKDGTTIEGWHIIHNCPVAIRCVPEFSAECPWIEKTYCNRWPADSFSDWRPLSEGSEEK